MRPMIISPAPERMVAAMRAAKAREEWERQGLEGTKTLPSDAGQPGPTPPSNQDT